MKEVGVSSAVPLTTKTTVTSDMPFSDNSSTSLKKASNDTTVTWLPHTSINDNDNSNNNDKHNSISNSCNGKSDDSITINDTGDTSTSTSLTSLNTKNIEQQLSQEELPESPIYSQPITSMGTATAAAAATQKTRGTSKRQLPRFSDESTLSSTSCPSIYEDEFLVMSSTSPFHTLPSESPSPLVSSSSPNHAITNDNRTHKPKSMKVHFPHEDRLPEQTQTNNPTPTMTTARLQDEYFNDHHEKLSQQSEPPNLEDACFQDHDDEKSSQHSEPVISDNNNHHRRSVRSMRRKARKHLGRAFSTFHLFGSSKRSSSRSSSRGNNDDDPGRDLLTRASESHVLSRGRLMWGGRQRRHFSQEDNIPSTTPNGMSESRRLMFLSQSESHHRSSRSLEEPLRTNRSRDDTAMDVPRGYRRTVSDGDTRTRTSTRLSLTYIQRIDDSLSDRSASCGKESSVRAQHHRGAITTAYMSQSNHFSDYHDFERSERCKEWMSSFRRSDPRYRVLKYFHDVAQDGCDNIEEKGINPLLVSPLLRMFYHASVFTVWRPTRIAAIRKMMGRQAVGKGLDIKGKSAVKGKLSGYVPYVQISENEHKRKIRNLPRTAKMRIFFASESCRDEAQQRLDAIALEMSLGYGQAKRSLPESTLHLLKDHKDTMEIAMDRARENEPTAMVDQMKKYLWEATDYNVVSINTYAPQCYGLEVSQRVFWEAYVMRNDIEREPDSPDDTGRPSEPAFMDMNNASVRSMPKYSSDPRAVVWQIEESNPMDPLNLVMAYEDTKKNRVTPVASDFDCFLVGTRGVKFQKPLPDDQVECMKSCIANIEKILESPHQRESWTRQWLQVLKERKDTPPVEVPRFGFGDPKSYSIMEHAIENLKDDGCVRHGAECFNYIFPQELDDLFLVISDYPLEGTDLSWKYVNVEELQSILLQRIDLGYTFPLNPKWILCDPGWKRVYDKLFASPKENTIQSLDAWYPPESGIREDIQSIYSRHFDGFQRRSAHEAGRPMPGHRPKRNALYSGGTERDLAEFELGRHVHSHSAKMKVKLVVELLKERKEQTAKDLVAQKRWKLPLTPSGKADQLSASEHQVLENLEDCRGSSSSFDVDLSELDMDNFVTTTEDDGNGIKTRLKYENKR